MNTFTHILQGRPALGYRHGVYLTSGMLVSLIALSEAFVIMLTALAWWVGYVRLGHGGFTARYAAAMVLGAVAFVLVQYFSGQYERARLHTLNRRLFQVWLNWLLSVIGLVALAFALKVSDQFSRIWLFGWLSTGALALTANRLILSGLAQHFAQKGRVGERVAIFGATGRGRALMRYLRHGRYPYVQLVGLFDDRQDGRAPASITGMAVEGGVDALIKAARDRQIDTVVLALPWSASERLWQLIAALEAVSVDVRLAPAEIGYQLAHQKIERLAAVPMLTVWARPIKEWHAVAKWVEDKLIAGMALLFLSPLLALLALAIKLESPGPVFFRQQRFGFNNEAISVLKFRTMYVDRQDVSGAARTTRDDPRVTRLGRFLRRSSLDEVPQLINVLRGEMSIVGPRPHAVAMRVGDQYYFDAVKGYAARHRVRPGITGWAQVNGLRGEIDNHEKARARLEHDLFYVNNWSLGLDLRIVAATFLTLWRDQNAY